MREIKWQDVTSYSQSDKERIPRTFQAQLGVIGLTITRHKDYDADDWVFSTYPNLLYKDVLDSKDLEDAKKEALTLLEKEVMKLQASINLIKQKEVQGE